MHSLQVYMKLLDKSEFEKSWETPCNRGALMVIYTKQLWAFEPAEEILRKQEENYDFQ